MFVHVCRHTYIPDTTDIVKSVGSYICLNSLLDTVRLYLPIQFLSVLFMRFRCEDLV